MPPTINGVGHGVDILPFDVGGQLGAGVGQRVPLRRVLQRERHGVVSPDVDKSRMTPVLHGALVHVVGLVHVAQAVGEYQRRFPTEIELIRQVQLGLHFFVLQTARLEVGRRGSTLRRVDRVEQTVVDFVGAVASADVPCEIVITATSTTGDTDILDLSADVEAFVNETGVREGWVMVFVPGSTGAVTTIEFESGALITLGASWDV